MGSQIGLGCMNQFKKHRISIISGIDDKQHFGYLELIEHIPAAIYELMC